MAKKTNDVLYSPEEKMLSKESTMIEWRAMEMEIKDDAGLEEAGRITKEVKATQKKVEEYWEPMRASTYAAYKAVTDHKKEMLDPLKNAESILKKKMSAYQVEKERKRREEQERLRKLAEEEMRKKLAEAEEAEKNGDVFGAEFAKSEADVYSGMAVSAQVPKTETKVDGISFRKAWEITNINLKELPDEFLGVLIRPADLKAIISLIKDSNGTVKIPGVEYAETVNVAARAS